jgi:hypothetical protein
MDTPPRREGDQKRVFKESDNSHRLYDSTGHTDLSRNWKHLLKEQITEKDNAQKRSEGKTPLIRIDSNPTRMREQEENDVSDAEVVDDGKPLSRKGGGNPPPRRKRRR